MSEPVAVVGMACRLPRAATPAAYWDLLRGGVECVDEPPPARAAHLEPPPWLLEAAPRARRGGFLDAIDRFDPAFFRLSPREAARMDPQQRLLLEVAWEALEDAGAPALSLSGTMTGVFVGVMNADFARQHAQDLRELDAQLGAGSSLGIAPNRVSFFLDVRGPSMAVDTLCSSSLVSIHLACQSLRSGETTLAIAGGVNVILDRAMDVFYARAGLLSADGRCRAFDAGARGIVRGEGCALVVLKPLSRAQADGDRIHAVILGSAVNQDGRSNGLTSPSRASQEEVLRAAYDIAGVDPHDVAYVEAHGTGTLIGDPIEAAALGAIVGRPGRPCAIGSVKSNLGHLESAAGVASLLKAALSLEHATLTPSLHFDAPNPYARLAERGLAVQTAVQPWPDDARKIAGVSSFGMGGTNAHVVLGAAPLGRERRARATGKPVLLPFAAHAAAALDDVERRGLDEVARGDDVLAEDVAHSLGTRGNHLDHRRVHRRAPGAAPEQIASGQVVAGRALRIVLAGVAAPDGVTADVALEADDDVVPHLGDDFTIVIAPAASLATQRAALERARATDDAKDGVVLCGDDAQRVVAELYCLGAAIDWRAQDAPGARFVALGPTPFQLQRCWHEPKAASPSSAEPKAPASTSAAPAAATPVLTQRWVRAPLPVLASTARTSTARARVGAVGDDALARAFIAARGAHVGDLDAERVVVFGDLAAAVRVTQELVRRAAARVPRLFFVTHGLAQAPVAGFARVVANEHPRLRATLVEVAGDDTPGDVEAIVRELIAEIEADDDETEVRLAGERLVARVERHALQQRARVRPEGAVLITGGHGGLGLAAARLLVERGARRLVLVSRSGALTEVQRGWLTAGAAGAAGTDVVEERADVTDGAALRAIWQRHDIRGVIHAAGTMAPAMIAAVRADEADASNAAKIEGALRLHELDLERSDRRLDFFVMYSSVAAFFGTPGQGVYAAGNAFLDALAERRRALGRAATSVAWSVVTNTGMAAGASEVGLRQLADRGLASISLDEATAALDHVLAAGDDAPPRVAVAPFDARRWRAFYPLPPRIAALAARDDAPAAAAAPSASSTRGATSPAPDIVDALRRASPQERRRAVEARLERIAAEVLHHTGPEPLDVGRPLADLGVDSLTALELQSFVEAELGVTLAADRLAGAATLRDLSDEVAERLAPPADEADAASTAAPLKRGAVSLVDDARLGEGFVVTARGAVRARPRDVLLTGATGFLGAFLLHEILERTDAHVRCLVRASGAPLARVKASLTRYGLPTKDLEDRVVCVAADLASPRLGLSEDAFALLADSVDAIIHSGASVNFVYPYEELRAANVLGTREVLRLAASGRAKRLHHVSTIGVFPGGAGPREIVHEASPATTTPEQLPLGYMRSKWVAERLVVQARERGLATAIHRPGTITGDAQSGAFNPDDFLCAMFKGCIELGAAPAVDVPVHLAPVDYVSRAIVALAWNDGPSADGAHHLVSAHAPSWRSLVASIRRLGYELRELPYAAWRSLLLERAKSTSNALAPMLPLFSAHESADWVYLPPFDAARTASALAHLGVVCPEIDDELVARYVARFVADGYLQQPTAPRRS